MLFFTGQKHEDHRIWGPERDAKKPVPTDGRNWGPERHVWAWFFP